MRIASALFQSVVAILVFVGLIDIVFAYQGLHFIIQFIFVLGLVFMLFVSLLAMHNQFRMGWMLLVFIYALVLLDLLWTWFLRSTFTNTYFLTLILAALGLVTCVASMPQRALPPTESIDSSVEKLETYGKPKQATRKNSRRKTAKKRTRKRSRR